MNTSNGSAPEWLTAQMPPGYQTRFAEIQRLSSELHGMDRIGRLLWECGPALQEAICEAFASLNYELEVPESGPAQIIVKLDPKRRLLLCLPESDGPLEKKSPELARAFQIVHESAADGDRVVMAANPHRSVSPTERPEPPVPADALGLLSRLGVNFMTTGTLFGLWTLGMKDQPRARTSIDRLHAQDGGVFK